ncbi:MAG: cell wall anchor protein, partial [Thomasclavelia spiroformis]
MTTIHAADTNVSFDGDAEDFIFLDGSQDLFDNFKNIMPGEVRTQNIVLKNDDHRELRFYLSADVLDSLDTDTSGLSVYNITITNEGEEFY